jgi:signal transduction histidine kinase
MNVPAAIAITAAAIAVLAGAMSRRLSLAPGWRDQHGFSLVAFTAAAYALFNLGTTLQLPDAWVVLLSGLQTAAATLHLWAWLRYSEVFAGVKPSPAVRSAGHGLLVLAALVAIPHVAFSPVVVSHEFRPFETVYRDAIPTPFGYCAFVYVFAVAFGMIGRFVRASRAGIRHAALHALATGSLVAFGLNDALATTGQFATPYLLDTGFAFPIVAVYWTVATRFVENARALHQMRTRLEDLIDARTRELADAQAALHQAEKLAALGEFAAGVAHGVSNPAAVVTANLRAMERALADADAPADAREAAADALASMDRINELTRKLVDAGRIAATAPGGVAALSEVVGRSVAEARAQAGDRLEIVAQVPEGLHVRARADTVVQVLSSLLSNAADAAVPGRQGRIVIGAERQSHAVRLMVVDDGAGMTPEVLRRAFDPFFTTKADGHGRGLGLAVSRGVVEGHGGMLWLESAPGLGTRAVLELPEAAPRADEAS